MVHQRTACIHGCIRLKILIFLFEIILLILCFLFIAAEYVHPCRKADPELNDCIRTTLNHLRPYVLEGIYFDFFFF